MISTKTGVGGKISVVENTIKMDAIESRREELLENKNDEIIDKSRRKANEPIEILHYEWNKLPNLNKYVKVNNYLP